MINAASPVAKVLLAECRLPLPRPIRLGSVAITTRDYVAMRLVAADGRHGDAIGYPRGTPLREIAAGMANEVIGTLPDERAVTIRRMLARRVNARSSFIRAASLFDIALGDLAAKAAGKSWGALNGGTRTHAPLMAVAGYYLDERSIDDVAREVGDLLAAGYARVKIMLRGDDLDFDCRYVAACTKVAEGRLAADAHWSFESLDHARAYLRPLDNLGLVFIEDPFGAHLNGKLAELQSILSTPLAAGEDMPDEFSLAALSGSIGILRVDATTCGGLTAASEVVRSASATGSRILPHIFAPLHAQLATVSADVEMIEIIPEAVGADPLGRLLERSPRIAGGQIEIDQQPGAGIALDWAAVGTAATAVNTIEQQT
jgi:L-alanine-DL-glutamate epimerase-like enolase superfamily enzyme